MQNRVFFPQTALDEWIVLGSIELSGTELTILGEGRKYRLAEAVYVQREVSGSPDLHELVGRVKSVQYLDELGAEVVGTSILLGDNAYDVIPGWLSAPVGTFDDHMAAMGQGNARNGNGKEKSGGRDEPRTDEELLARFLVKTL